MTTERYGDSYVVSDGHHVFVQANGHREQISREGPSAGDIMQREGDTRGAAEWHQAQADRRKMRQDLHLQGQAYHKEKARDRARRAFAAEIVGQLR